MTTDTDLERWILDALQAHSGEASIVEIAKHIWTTHEAELRKSDELFFTWQYKMRWAGQVLQQKGNLRKSKRGAKANWILLKR
jgi:hypothetical protein